MNKITSFGFVFCLALCGGLSSAEAATTLRSQTEVNRLSIRLGDVFDGLPEGIDRDIATAPTPGKSVTYDVNVLTKLAQQYRLDWQAQQLSDQCTLTRASTRITQEMIGKTIIDKITARKADLKNAQIDVLFDNKTLEIRLPADLSSNFVLNNFDYDPENRHFRADLVAGSTNAPVVQTVTGRVVLKRDVPVLAHRLEEGTIITENDLTWLTLPEERVTPDMLTAPANLIGHALRRDSADSLPLRARDVMQPRLVTHGSLVTMRIETPVLVVTAQGRAMQDGSLGEVIKITNTQSKRVIEGVVSGSGTVSIALPQNMPTMHAAAKQGGAATESRWR